MGERACVARRRRLPSSLASLPPRAKSSTSPVTSEKISPQMASRSALSSAASSACGVGRGVSSVAAAAASSRRCNPPRPAVDRPRPTPRHSLTSRSFRSTSRQSRASSPARAPPLPSARCRGGGPDAGGGEADGRSRDAVRRRGDGDREPSSAGGDRPPSCVSTYISIRAPGAGLAAGSSAFTPTARTPARRRRGARPRTRRPSRRGRGPAGRACRGWGPSSAGKRRPPLCEGVARRRPVVRPSPLPRRPPAPRPTLTATPGPLPRVAAPSAAARGRPSRPVAARRAPHRDGGDRSRRRAKPLPPHQGRAR